MSLTLAHYPIVKRLRASCDTLVGPLPSNKVELHKLRRALRQPTRPIIAVSPIKIVVCQLVIQGFFKSGIVVWHQNGNVGTTIYAANAVILQLLQIGIHGGRIEQQNDALGRP